MALSDLFNPILAAIKRLLGPFGKVFDLVSRFFTSFRDSFNKGLELSKEIISEINEWRNFKQAVPVRTGVISLPVAIDKSEQLLGQIKAAWNSIVDLAKEIQKQAHGQQADPTTEAEEAVADIENSGFRGLIEKFPKLAKGLERILGFLAVIVGVLETVQKTIDDLKNIVDAVRGIRQEIETGDTIFLQQKNPRKSLRLDDGKEIKVRVGKLHQL